MGMRDCRIPQRADQIVERGIAGRQGHATRAGDGQKDAARRTRWYPQGSGLGDTAEAGRIVLVVGDGDGATQREHGGRRIGADAGDGLRILAAGGGRRI